jgi:hypothetical protein
MRIFLEKNPILVFSEPFVKLLATVKHNVLSLVITGIRLQLSRVSRQIDRGIISYDSYACLVLVDSYYHRRLKRTTRRPRSSAKITTTARTIMDNDNCESINYVFEKAVDWTPQPIPKLTTKQLNVIRIQHTDLKRFIYGTGNYELCGRYKRHNVSHQCWFSKTLEQRECLFQKLLNDHTPLVTAVKSTCSDFEVTKPLRLAKKPHQNKRPRTNRTQPRY